MEKKQTTFIIDFDSTFISLESLDELFRISLKDNPDTDNVLKKITDITRKGMEGTIPFDQSLKQRIALLKANKQHIKKLIPILIDSITASIKANEDFFKKNSNRVYIISGGFKDYIAPVVESLGIPADHVIANSFTYNKEGEITGYDEANPLSKEQGKVKAVNALHVQGKIVVIGDGYTDLQIKEAGAADTFIAYTEHVRREPVVARADAEAVNFNEVLFMFRLPRAHYYPKSKMKVLLLENINKRAEDSFKKQGYNVVSYTKALNDKELAKEIEDVSILCIRSKTIITDEILSHANKLLVIGAYCIGTNQIDIQACTERGVAVFNAPFSNSRSVVELVIGYIIMLMRNVHDKTIGMHNGVWNKSASGSFEIRGKTLGIIGYGNIGMQLSVLAEAMGMYVIFYNRGEKLAVGNAKPATSLHGLLKQADIISLHVNGDPENRNLISTIELGLMKKGSYLINTSRGHIVDLNALKQAIQDEHIAGVALDVFPEEPASNDEPFITPVQKLPNVILSPHVGGSTMEAQVDIADFVTKYISAFIDTGSTAMCLNMPGIRLRTAENSFRFIHIHRNVPGVLAKINTVLATHSINISGQYLKTTENVGYVITDINKTYNKELIRELRAIPATIKFRVLY